MIPLFCGRTSIDRAGNPILGPTLAIPQPLIAAVAATKEASAAKTDRTDAKKAWSGLRKGGIGEKNHRRHTLRDGNGAKKDRNGAGKEGNRARNDGIDAGTEGIGAGNETSDRKKHARDAKMDGKVTGKA
jgi:hypothetical protein